MPTLPDGSIDYSEDFFGKPAFLTVSGQVCAGLWRGSERSSFCFCTQVAIGLLVTGDIHDVTSDRLVEGRGGAGRQEII